MILCSLFTVLGARLAGTNLMRATMIDRIFIGWDSREDAAYKVCRHSLERRNSNLSNKITRLNLEDLRANDFYRRSFSVNANGQKIDDIDGRPFSTDFSFSRFLVPSLMNYEGWAIFVDCDFLFLTDIAQLNQYLDSKYAAICVHHNYHPTETLKMDGVRQERYFRKNWSSFVLWNCGHPANRVLTTDIVNTQTGAYLHKFGWLEDSMIGSLPEEWNWLEGHSSKAIKPKAIHYTRGGPWFENYRDVDYADLWIREYEIMTASQYELRG